MPRNILLVKIAWNSSKWRHPNLNDFNNRNRYGYSFIKDVGFGYEWWNFDDVPKGSYQNWNMIKEINSNRLPYNPDDWYYGYFENNDKLPIDFINAHKYSPNNPNIYGGIIVFISRNVYDYGNFYFVGLYYDAFFLHDGSNNYYLCDTSNNLLNNLPFQIGNYIQNNPNANNRFQQCNVCPHNPNLKTIKNIIGKKELSFVLDKPIKITPEDINVEKIEGRWQFSYKLDDNPRLLLDLLIKALCLNRDNPILVKKIISILCTYDHDNNVFR